MELKIDQGRTENQTGNLVINVLSIIITEERIK